VRPGDKREQPWLPRQQSLREQIEQAKRLAAAMTKLRDQEWFERNASIIGVKSTISAI
jgi:hypothetical protein